MVRHAQTDWNAEGRIQGQLDTPLSALGRAQAASLVPRLADESWDALYVSDLRRACDTAAPLVEARGVVACPDTRLREIAFGCWEGLSFRDLAASEPAAYAAWRGDDRARPHGGESLADVAERGGAMLEECAANHGGDAVLWVAHGGFLRILLCRVLGLPLRIYGRFRLDSASVSTIEVDDKGAIVTLWNDNRHTGDEAHLAT